VKRIFRYTLDGKTYESLSDMPPEARRRWDSLMARMEQAFPGTTVDDLPQADLDCQASRRTLRGVVLLGLVLAWTALFFVSLSRQFIAGDFLYSLAWKYSAILTVPLGVRFSIYAFKSTEIRRQLGPRHFWFTVLALPLITYSIVGFSVMKIPAALVFFLPISHSSEVVTLERFGPNPQQCLGKSSINTKEYSSFMQTAICLPGEFVRTLKPGDLLYLEGKRGLGGFLVERYGKAAANH
jgi:hypothetical protein